MPRRARRAASAASSSTPTPPAPPPALPGSDVALTLANVLRSLHDQRELRVDVGEARKRAALLDAQLAVLRGEHERTVQIKDKLDTLSRELTRQNRTVIEESERVIAEEKRRRDAIVRRFNDAMRDVNDKLARQGAAAVATNDINDAKLRARATLRDARERFRCRAEHYASGVRRRALERQLAVARVREARDVRDSALRALAATRQQAAAIREEHRRLHVGIARVSAAAGDAGGALDEVRAQLARVERRVDAHVRTAKEIQQGNSRLRNENVATGIRIKAMHAEDARLQAAIASVREAERRERGKREALERLYKQVTAERAELRNDVLIMQEAWSNLKSDTESLRGTVAGGGNRVFEVLQSIMSREYLDVAVTDVVTGSSSIEDAIREELSNLKLAADALPPALLDFAQAPLAATASVKRQSGAASSRRS